MGVIVRGKGPGLLDGDVRRQEAIQSGLHCIQRGKKVRPGGLGPGGLAFDDRSQGANQTGFLAFRLLRGIGPGG